MNPKDIRIEEYNYNLPELRIAKYPLEERDHSKLLIYQRGDISETIFKHIADHIPEGSMLVFNETRVIHARLIFQKPTGGIIEIFCLEPGESHQDIQIAMLQKKSVLWKCMVGGASKWKEGQILSLSFGSHTLYASKSGFQEGTFLIQFTWDNIALTFAEVLQYAGQVPLPPYLNRNPEEKDNYTYQTVYARHEGSVAAPTAGLHFTAELLHTLGQKNIHTSFVTLHVGAGTFKPVKSELLADHEMHEEWITIDKVWLQKCLQHQSNIIAVGTTSLRTLESLYHIGLKLIKDPTHSEDNVLTLKQWEPYEANIQRITMQESWKAILAWMDKTGKEKLIAKTGILIAPGYKFGVAHGLITNFHQPGSTLLLLIAAGIGEDWKKVYQYALEHNYRFLSYGDSSLLWIREEFRK